jgi:hypothetical protein
VQRLRNASPRRLLSSGRKLDPWRLWVRRLDL